jgi:hypothetical protein
MPRSLPARRRAARSGAAGRVEAHREGAEVAIAAAEAAGATLIFPGNLYNYGKPLPARIDFEGAPRPGDEAGWTAALAGPLSACAAGRRADANTGGADSAGAALSR